MDLVRRAFHHCLVLLFAFERFRIIYVLMKFQSFQSEVVRPAYTHTHVYTQRATLVYSVTSGLPETLRVLTVVFKLQQELSTGQTQFVTKLRFRRLIDNIFPSHCRNV